MPRISAKAETFGESVIRDMTRLALRHEAVNLAQGFPDFPCPPELKEAAKAALDADINQYAITWGAKRFRDAIAAKTSRTYPGWSVDPDTQVTVVCGATEGMISAMLAILDPGDEIVVFEPFYENYGPDAILSGAVPRYVTLHEPDWSIDEDELRAAFTSRTRGIVITSPHNPTGKVFTRAELDLIAELCRERDVVAFTDEIYEHIVYEGEHIPLATLPGMAERVVAVNSMLPDSYYDHLATDYQTRRDALLPSLEAAGFRVFVPDGAYYVMTDISGIAGGQDDVTFAKRLVVDPGVATVPGSSFYSRPELGRSKIRFAFPKRPETLAAAAERLSRLRVPAA